MKGRSNPRRRSPVVIPIRLAVIDSSIVTTDMESGRSRPPTYVVSSSAYPEEKQRIVAKQWFLLFPTVHWAKPPGDRDFMDTAAQEDMLQNTGDIVASAGDMDVAETRSVQTQTSMIASHNGDSITYPYRMLLKNTSFPLCHLMARPGSRADTFTGSLSMLGHGTPLWNPTGNFSRPKAQLISGISIGDVGFLDGGGDFKTYFNIFLPPDHPAQLHCPPNFIPLEAPLDSEIAVKQMQFPPGTALVSSGIEATMLSSSPLDIKFTVNVREGGILVLPDGASREDLLSTTRIRDYAQENVLKWYQLAKKFAHDFVVHPNGTLYVVTGTDKATTWANCVTYHKQARIHHLWEPSTITYRGVKGERQHHWESNRETDTQLTYKRSAKSEHIEKCALFIRGMRIAVNVHDWTKHLLDYQAPNVATFSLIRTVPIFGLQAKLQTLKECRPGYRQMIPVEGGVGMRIIFHPLDVILRLLLEEFPSSTIAYIEDQTWCSVADKSDFSLSSIIRLLVEILETHEMFMEDGRITLVPIATNIQKPIRPRSWNLFLRVSTYIKQKYRARRQRREILNRIAKVFPGPRVPVDLLSSQW